MVPEGLLGVAEVGRRTGLSRKALRHYEELGLVEPATRTDAGYRLYDGEALRRIERGSGPDTVGSLKEAAQRLERTSSDAAQCVG